MLFYAAYVDKSISSIATRRDLIQYAHDESLPEFMLNHVHHVDTLLASLCIHQQYVLMWVTLQRVLQAGQAFSNKLWACTQAPVAQREASMLRIDKHAENW